MRFCLCFSIATVKKLSALAQRFAALVAALARVICSIYTHTHQHPDNYNMKNGIQNISNRPKQQEKQAVWAANRLQQNNNVPSNIQAVIQNKNKTVGYI